MKQTKLFLTRTAAMLFAVLLSHAAWGGGALSLHGTFTDVDYNSEYTNYSLNSGAFKVYLYTDHCAFTGLDAEGEEKWSELEKTLAYNEDAYEGEKLFSMEYRGEKGVKVVPQVTILWYPSSDAFLPTNATDLFDITYGTNQEFVVPVENYLDKNGNFNKNVPSVTISVKEKYKGKSVKLTQTDPLADEPTETELYFNLSDESITKHYVITPKKLTLKALSIPRYDPENEGEKRYRFYNGQPVTTDEFKPGGTMPDNGYNPNYGLYSVWMNGKQYSNTSSILFGGYEYFVRTSGVNVFVWDDNGKIDITNVSKDPVILSWGIKEGNSSLTIGQRTPGDYSTDDIATNNFDIKFEDGEVYISPLPIKVELSGDGYEKYFAKDAKKYYYDGNSVTVDGWTTKATNMAGKDVTSLLKFEPNTDGVMKCTSVKYNATSGDKWETWSTLTDNGEIRMKMVPESVEIADDNFQLVEADDAITINQGGIKLLPRPITITTGDLKKAYDGTPLVGKDEFEVTKGTLATYNKKDEWIEINFTGSQTEVGKSSNTAEAVVWRQGFGEEKMISQNDKGVSNYDITYVFGTLEVTSAVFTVTITGHNGTFTYNGSVHTVEGFDASWDETQFPGFKKEYITYNGSTNLPVVQSKEEGKSFMKLKANKFGSNNETYQPNFEIKEDGWLVNEYYKATLYDNVDNTAEIQKIARRYGAIADVTLKRSFPKDGTWYTICLPFAVTVADSPLAGADVREMAEASLDEGKMTLNFSETSVTNMEAGKPYIVKWAEGESLVNPEFKEAEFDEDLEDQVVENPFDLGDDKSITFKGTYAPVSYAEADDNSVLLVGDGNSLYYPTKGASLGAFRAFFQLDGLTAYEPAAVEEEAASEAPVFVLSFGATNVKNAIMEAVSGEYYDLSGRRVAQPTKGIYIVNGKKVVVK